MRRTQTSPGIFVLALALAAAASACGSAAESVAGGEATTITTGEEFPDGIPAAAEPPVLTITGAAGPANDEGAISFDLATLERLGLQEWTVFEPFVDGNRTFRGVPFEVVLEVVGIPEGTTEATMTALDDYAITLPLTDLQNGDILLVTQDDLEGPIGVDRGGPIRFIFRDGSTLSTNPDLWIWSLRSVELR